MKIENVLKTIAEEIIANGIGWLAGLASVDLLNNFFVRKAIWNLGGIFSKRIAVSKDEFSFLEWLVSVIIGFIVMLVINKLIREKLLKKKWLRIRLKKKKTEELSIDNIPEDKNSSITNL